MRSTESTGQFRRCRHRRRNPRKRWEMGSRLQRDGNPGMEEDATDTLHVKIEDIMNRWRPCFCVFPHLSGEGC